MNLSDGIIPHSTEWEAIRLKRLTSSYIHKIFVSGKSKDKPIGVGGLTYLDTKLAEMLTGVSESQAPETDDVMRGVANEPDAISRYAEITNHTVHESMLFEYNSIMAGTTDGMVCYKGTEKIKIILEAKCPRAAKHVKVCKVKAPIELKDIDPQYYHQPQSNLMICEAECADFISYCEDIKVYDAQIAIVRIYPDLNWRKEFKEKIDWIADYFCESLEEILKCGEKNLRFRVQPEENEVKKLQSAIENITKTILSK